MIYGMDRARLISKCCRVIEVVTRADFRIDKTIKLHIVNRVALLELQKEIEEILEKCKDDGY